MTESESSQEILKLLHELNLTIKSIDSKLDNKVNEVNEVDIDESSGDVNITRKLLQPSLIFSKKYKSESESLSKSEKRYRRIAEENVYNISKDIQDGVYDICMAMQKYYIDDELNALACKPRINKLHHKLISKYINKGKIKSIEPFWKDDSYPKDAIIHWF